MPSGTVWLRLDESALILRKIHDTWKGRREIKDLRAFLAKTFPNLKVLPNYDGIYASKGIWTCLAGTDKKLLEVDFYAGGEADLFDHASLIFRRFADLGNYSVDSIDFKPERISFRQALRIALFPQGSILAAVTTIASGIGGLPSVGPFYGAGIGATAILLVYLPVMTFINTREAET